MKYFVFVFIFLVSCDIEEGALFKNEILVDEINAFIIESQNVKMNNECSYILMYWEQFNNRHFVSLHRSRPFDFEDLYCIINYKGYKILVYSNYDLSEYIIHRNSYSVDTSTLVKATNFEISKAVNWYSSGFYFDGKKTYSLSSVTTEAIPFEGNDNFVNNFIKQINYPQNTIENRIEGEVLVVFDISENGKISNVKLLRGLNSECDQEVLKAVSEIPLLNPKTIFNEPVKTKSYVRITFILDSLYIEIESSFGNASKKLLE